MHEFLNAIIDELIETPKRINTRLRGILSDSSIKEFNKKNKLIEGIIQEGLVHPNSIGLTLSNTWRREIPNRTEAGFIDPNIPPKYEEGRFTSPSDILDPYRRRNPWEPTHYTEHEHYILNAKNYVLIDSKEIINIPSGYVGYVCPIQEKIQSGVSIDTETFIEAGFRDHITFSLFNRNSAGIVLFSSMEIAKILFMKAELCSFLKR